MNAPDENAPGPWRGTATGAAALAAAALTSWLASRAAQGSASDERFVIVAGAVLVLTAALALGAWCLARRGLGPAGLATGALAVAALALAAGYLVWAGSALGYRADILIWSEGPFVQDILKLRTGAPLYGPAAELSSFFYTPGSQLLTWLLATAAGAADSIPAYRVIQLLYAAAAALVTARITWRLSRAAGNEPRAEGEGVWWVTWTALAFLAATNALTNPFSHLLHNDALGLLISATAYLLLVEYLARPRAWLVGAMALIPAAGFLVKQSLGIWAPFLGLFLLASRPVAWRRVFAFGVGAAVLLVAAYAACRALWGDAFQYWVITAMGNHPVSPLRAVQHALDAWAYLAGGIVAALVLVPLRRPGPLLLAWLVWAALFALESWTSGIAWMLNHLGPGSLLAAAWLGAALHRVWPRHEAAQRREPGAWLTAAAGVACAVLAANGLGMVRVPAPAITDDHERYAAAIEAEFRGQDPARVLLDAGTWVYLPDRVIMGDRSAAVGELGNNLVGDFSGILARIGSRAYARILVRDWDTDELAYDHPIWPRPSGIRAALAEHYRVVRTIPGVERGWRSVYLHTVSVLEPRDDAAPAAR